ncbi:MAG: 6,7-dimethyl-8-ribityllumazine synthase [Planctomycetes bacterium]|nr:6,7-dimethyl-8-ribityllumazine synthase [Planctomycetota bacterium]
MARDLSSSKNAVTPRPGMRIACVLSEFHLELTSAMMESARTELMRLGMAEGDFCVVNVPGAFELPLVARRLASHDSVDAVLCFGLVITGETKHDHWVSMGATEGILLASLETDKPILFGVLTCNTIEQARARALSPDAGGVQDKGREVAAGAVQTLNALDQAEHPFA